MHRVVVPSRQPRGRYVLRKPLRLVVTVKLRDTVTPGGRESCTGGYVNRQAVYLAYRPFSGWRRASGHQWLR
jgi:hypothetical protein